MLPEIVPGLGMGVAEGATVGALVAEGPIVSVKVGEAAWIWVLVGCTKVGEASGCEVGEDSGVCGTDWVRAARVKTTPVATAPELICPGVAATGKLQAARQVTSRAEMIILYGLFIGEPPRK